LPEHKKQLGQYFTGVKLARLLARLSFAENVANALDPMAGDGDMLEAVREWAPSADLYGIELDARYADSVRNRLGRHVNVITGNAFVWETIARLPTTAFDLVITNPPYVRYQSLSVKQKNEFFDAESIRLGLLDIISQLPNLSSADRNILTTLAQSYSGLSDLAVPSWILCVAMVKPGGTLAMVAPESWLTRDFADVIRYLLLKLFRICWVVENETRDWFKEAQIKTSLLVAERTILPRKLPESLSGESYLRVALGHRAKDSRGPAGGLFPDRADPDTALRELMVNAQSKEPCPVTGVRIAKEDLSANLNNILATHNSSSWLQELEPWINSQCVSAFVRTSKLPQPLLNLLPFEETSHLQSPAEVGLSIGQGLRTGANVFFYCDLLKFGEGFSLIAPSKELDNPVLVPNDVLSLVLRKQAEVPEGFILDGNCLRGRVLMLDSYSSPEANVPEPGRGLMPEELRHLVISAQKTKAGYAGAAKLIPELAAVRTNVAKPRAKNDWIARHWFMLPPLTHRHRPDLFVARINYEHPKTMLNPGRAVIIDANFSTLWIEPTKSGPDILAFLALMNSTWCLTAMELLGTVMGGGALKLEATHIRRLPIPKLSSEDWEQLRVLGQALVTDGSHHRILEEIDNLIAFRLFGVDRAKESLAALCEINSLCLKARRTR
jgi:tRNA1(Val) A37 N6-methylase TrmN6